MLCFAERCNKMFGLALPTQQPVRTRVEATILAGRGEVQGLCRLVRAVVAMAAEYLPIAANPSPERPAMATVDGEASRPRRVAIAAGPKW